MDYQWPLDEEGNRKAIQEFTDLEVVRYQVYMARVESTLQGVRHIGEEIIYLTHWYFYFEALSRMARFDPEVLKYLHLEIGRLYKERVGWN